MTISANGELGVHALSPTGSSELALEVLVFSTLRAAAIRTIMVMLPLPVTIGLGLGAVPLFCTDVGHAFDSSTGASVGVDVEFDQFDTFWSASRGRLPSGAKGAISALGQ